MTLSIECRQKEKKYITELASAQCSYISMYFCISVLVVRFLTSYCGCNTQ